MLDSAEIEALDSIIRTLDGLSPEQRVRVTLYLKGRLDASVSAAPPMPRAGVTALESPAAHSRGDPQKITDIRQLRTDKAPRTDVEMAAVVGYYLQEEAPEEERKTAFDRGDIERYFKQAGHPLPNRPAMTLTNAKNAGYLDLVGQGEYKLNAVGYNLVAHNLPAGSGGTRPSKPKKKTTAKKAKPKTKSATSVAAKASAAAKK
jgi:hypothetical protein